MPTASTTIPRGGGSSRNPGTATASGNNPPSFLETIPGTPLFSVSAPIQTESKCPASKSAAIFGSVWGTMGVVYVLVKAIKRVLPIALEPFQKDTTLILTPFQWR